MRSADSVDLRSDTFTVPDAAMRKAMAEAEVGDDVWGEDPTVRRLEEMMAARLGKQAGLFVASGTMGNLVSVAAQTRPGDEVIGDAEAHLAIYEVAGTAVVAGIQLRLLDSPDGIPTAEAVRAAIREPNIHFPITRLLAIENTHNRRGGGAVGPERVAAAAEVAHQHGVRVHCDGARLFNAAVALECDAATLVRDCDSVSVCLSKGLGAPVGSVVAGEEDFIAQARSWRKRLGGGMRQAGVIAAGGVFALEHNVDRLAEDHANARRLAHLLTEAGIDVVAPPVPTNMVMLRTRLPAAEVVEQAAQAGVLLSAAAPRLVRCMTYLGVGEVEVDRAGEVLCDILALPRGEVAGKRN